MLRNLISVTLSSGQTVSGVAKSAGLRLAGVYVPKAFSGTVITLMATANGMNGVGPGIVSDGAGASYTRTVASATDTYVPIPKDIGAGIDTVQFKSGTSQSGDCTLVAVFVDN